MVSRFELQPPRLSDVLWRALLLVTVVVSSIRLGLAEIEYAHGWRDDLSMRESVAALDRAVEWYPFHHRFREATGKRFGKFGIEGR